MKEQLVSYAQHLEDVILYHVFHDENEIFYVDCGANDATYLSVTKLLYDCGKAHGINIDPLPACIASYRDRKRDICICAGIGRESGRTATFYYDNETSTGASFLKNDYLQTQKTKEISVPIFSLQDVLKQNMDKLCKSGFLKLDIEGYEEEALLGMNFSLWHPDVLVIESDSFEQKKSWEELLVKNGYGGVFYYGGSRYYVDDMRQDLKKRFIPVEEIVEKYDIFVPYDRLSSQKAIYETSTSWKITKMLREVKKFRIHI